MAKPNLSIAIEPTEEGAVVVLPLAAAAEDEGAFVKIIVRLRITNNETKAVTITAIRFSFPGSQIAPITMQGTDVYYDYSLKDIGSGMTATWSNGKVDLDPLPGDDHVNLVPNIVFVAAPGPSKLTVSLTCAGYSEPATVTVNLAAHKSPTPQGAYLFPFSAGDLRDGEYMVTSADHWANGGASGPQIYAHDIGVHGVDPKSKKMSSILPGGSDEKNEDYRIWGKPVRAVADGTVEAWHDGLADNTVLKKFPDPAPKPGEGNHIWVRHGTELLVYCHFQKDSIPDELKVKNAPVRAGQMLGLAGNSGNTTNPHTHIHCLRDSTSGPLRPLPFRNVWVLDHDRFNPPKVNDPWVKVNGQGISKKAVAIWPGSTWPTFKIPAAGIARGGDWANSYFLKPDLETFQKEAQDLFDKKGRRLLWVDSYQEHGHRRWAGIARAGDWGNSFWISPDLSSFQKTAQDLFDKKGRRLIHVTTFVEGGQRRWVGISRGGDWGNSFWISPDRKSFEDAAQDLFDKKGRRLVHLHTFVEGGHRRWVGISREADWANSFWISRDLDSFNREAQHLFDAHGRRLSSVEFLTDD